MNEEIEIPVSVFRLSDIFDRDYYIPIVAVFISADEQLCEKYLPETKYKIYKKTDAITYADLIKFTEIVAPQMTAINNFLHLILLLESYKPMKSERVYKGNGRGPTVVRIKKDENGDVYAKTVFERFVKHGLASTRSETFMRLACEYYDSNVD